MIPVRHAAPPKPPAVSQENLGMVDGVAAVNVDALEEESFFGASSV